MTIEPGLKDDNDKAVKKKGSKRLLIAGIAAAVIVALLAAYAFIFTSTGYWLLSRLKPDTEQQKMSYSSASQTTQAIADEGFVLMRNENNLLPLQTSEDAKLGLSLFGMRSVQLVFNAGGSSASNVERATKLEDALRGENGGFDVNPDLLNLYYNYYKSGKLSIAPTSAPANSGASEFIEEVNAITVPELPVEAFTDTALFDGKTVVEAAREYSDTALITIGRGGGEMFDFTPSGLLLSAEETAMVDAVANGFEHVVLVVNSANPMELDFIEQYPSIEAVVWIGFPGETGIESLAKILSGKVNPSGHLPDTWLKDNTAAPATNNYLQLNADQTKATDSFKYSNTPPEQGYFVQYSEGIYVGYRYFETRHDTDPAFNYDELVMYPFGHGLSYTEFEQQLLSVEQTGDTVRLRVAVRNTGDVAGKDVIEVYSNPPYTGAIEKSTVNLVAFEKTNEIAPGATENYTLEFPLEDLASFDDQHHGAWVLEAGEYQISIRANSHDVYATESFTLAAEQVFDEANPRSTDKQAAIARFGDALGVEDYLTREWLPEARAFTGPQDVDFTASAEVLAALEPFQAPTDASLGLTEADMPAIGQTLDQTIRLDEMVGVDPDDPKWDEFVSQLTLDEMATLSGNGAWHIEGIERLGIPKTLTPDGSTTIGASVYSGAIMGTDAKGVTYPTPVVVAATWNTDIANLMGTSVGTEAQALGYAGWYAPGMNTHRVPWNGRAFEYYSEDGVLAGGMSGNVVRGAREMGLITYMKHFALNDREANTRSYLMVWSNEQAMREIYLRPFEAAVKQGGSLGAMSSFNFIGTTWAGGDQRLLTDVLRNEWGFQGLVITDANMYSFMNPVAAVYAGGNLSLDVMASYRPGNTSANQLKTAAESPDTRIGMSRALHEATKQTLYAVAQTWPVTG